MVTLDAINLKIAKLQKQAATIAEKQTSVGLTKIRDLMHKHGLSIADIESFVGKKRGRKPAAKAPRASVHHVAPKYADPKTGATWTGRGRAPAWIRDVKDRSKFLIEAGEKKDAGTKAAPAKKVSAKRVVAKKAVRTPAAAKKAAGRRAAAPANGARARKAAAPAKRASTPRKVAAGKAPAAVEAGATPEVAVA
jgi:DNA-binding protein H-NS